MAKKLGEPVSYVCGGGGLTDESQQQSHDHTCANFMDPAYPLLWGSTSLTGSRVLVWDWLNKFIAQIVKHNLLCKFISPLTPPPPTPINICDLSGVRDARAESWSYTQERK